MDPLLLGIIRGDNPWLEKSSLWENAIKNHLPDIFIPRILENQLIREGFKTSKASLIVGPRQSGKSTLIWHITYTQHLKTLLLNCEEKLVQDITKSPVIFLNEMQNIISYCSVLFFEEVQHLEDAGIFIKGLIDRKPDIPVIVTGSSGYHLLSKTRGSLAGRGMYYKILPLSIKEIESIFENMPDIIRKEKLKDTWKIQCIYGGYPEVWTKDSKDALLSRLVEAFLIRDASDLYRIARPDVFRKLTRLLAGQIGNLVNYSEYASICGVSTDTIMTYIDILENSYTVHMLKPFLGGKRAEIKLRPKAYFIDCGLRNSMLGSFGEWENRPDKGPLLENWILSELLKNIPSNAEIYFWRSKSKAEVDFVIQISDKLIGMEVKAEQMRKPQISRSAQSFIAAYEPEKFVVINTGIIHDSKIGNSNVIWTTPENFLKYLF
jgi:predicted AAA+ superfamily ATPase